MIHFLYFVWGLLVSAVLFLIYVLMQEYDINIIKVLLAFISIYVIGRLSIKILDI